MVQLYAWNGPEDNVTNHQLFRGYIESLTDEVLIVQLTYAQRNAKVLPADSSYAVEHDSSDSVFVQAYRGLYQFLTAPDSRKRLLLGLRQPVRTLCQRSGRFHCPFCQAGPRLLSPCRAPRDREDECSPPGHGRGVPARKRCPARQKLASVGIHEPGSGRDLPDAGDA